MSSTHAPPVVVPSSSGNNIIVNPCQRGNPVLECIRNVGKEFGDTAADYRVGRTTGVLFLSLRYHRLHPEYIHTRIEKLGRSYDRRFLLILCDIAQHQEPIRELTKSCLINNITIIVAFSNDEAAHYLSMYKQYESKPPDMIKERVDKDYNAIFRSALTTIPKVNKTDTETLRSTFGSFAGISKATSDQLRNLPGFGQVKVKNIENAFKKPFRNDATTKLTDLPRPSPSQIAQTHRPVGVGDGTTRTQAPLVAPSQRPPREPSPTWDIELDLNEEVQDVLGAGSSKQTKADDPTSKTF
ncbi:DNA repair protein rad10 [Macrolepiota fuliginosa MF-IS2]|uniref:DNA repair protein rad10 n=1 Tax=Macrolepiota fuliginosa MF-IS2 TaxID=1400762 RepID=A0A9P5XFG2_9AGAR|nr:DNA repair protein rad10 [Macrolepiota fuliginosa MF-IS2]